MSRSAAPATSEFRSPFVDVVGVLLTTLLLVGILTPASLADGTKIGVCHATSSDANPYEYVEVDASSTDFQGHLPHQDSPTKIWKRAGIWNGVAHTAGEAKPDIIGTFLGLPVTAAICNARLTDPPDPADLQIDKALTGTGTPAPGTTFSFSVTCDGTTVTATVAADAATNWSWNAASGAPDVDADSTCSITETAPRGNGGVSVTFNGAPAAEGTSYDLTTGTNTFVVTNSYVTVPTSGVSVAKFVVAGSTVPAVACGVAPWAASVNVAVGSSVQWCLKVVNTGGDALSAVSVLDEIGDTTPDEPAGCVLLGSLPVGGEDECTYSSVASVAGTFTNYAAVSATGVVSGTPVTGTANASYTASTPTVTPPDPVVDDEVVPRNPGIAVEKSADADEYSVGDTITYTYVITNTGDTTLSGVALDDDVLGNLTSELSTRTLLPGDSVTVTVTQEALLDHVPSLTNVAVASGVSPGDGRISDTDSETVEVSAVLGIVIDNPPAPRPAPDPAPQAPPAAPDDPVEVAPARLARTGTDPLPATGLAMVLMALGSLLVRRRRSA